MSSATSMPPPPSPLAHRRTRLNSPLSSSSSSSYQDSSSTSCVPRKMSLSKAATFHVPSLPASHEDPVLSVPHLGRRSPTYSRAAFASWLCNEREAVSDILADFEQTFSGARGSRPAGRRRSVKEFEEHLSHKFQRASSPVDSGLGSSVSTPSDKGLSQTLEKALDLSSVKDSAIGESIADSTEIPRSGGEQLVQEANSSDNTSAPQYRSSGTHATPTITRKVLSQTAASTSSSHITQPVLSNFARRKISQNLIKPLLREEKYKDFHRIVQTAGSRSNKNLRCLRDIEQALILQPLTLHVSPANYRSYGEFTVQLVVDTFQHLSESEQRRASDRPYDSGYFLDLVQQVHQLAAHIGDADHAETNQTTTDEELPSIDDEITLEGGLGETGNLAELVRWRNGKGISLRTGLPYEPTPGMKREASTMAAEDAERSMARRKKGYIPEQISLPCSEPGCDKTFGRQCDLSKHEKTHSRPYKCADPRCKYHDFGLPTEKELDRHMNDKHNDNPKLYHCSFCEFKTKRESNCKQHMEKKHGWDYRRAKGKDKAIGGTPGQTPQTPSLAYSPAEPSPASFSWDNNSSRAGSVAGSHHYTPYEEPLNNFDNFTGQTYGGNSALFPRHERVAYNAENFNFNAPINTNVPAFGAYASPAHTTPSSMQMRMMTPQTPDYSTITSHGPSPLMTNMDCNNQQFNYGGMLTPDSGFHHSRHPSIADEGINMPPPPNPFANDMMMDDMPTQDFTLFGNEGAGAFTHATGGDVTLFSGHSDMQSQEYTADMFDVTFDDLNNTTYDEPQFDEFVNLN